MSVEELVKKLRSTTSPLCHQAADKLEELAAENGHLKNDLSDNREYVSQLKAALAEPATLCVGCEGNPSSENNPCAVCGKPAEPATDAEPVDWQYRFETGTERWTDWRKGKAPKWVKKMTNFEERPRYTHPPESRLREALEWAMRYVDQVRAENPLPEGSGEHIMYDKVKSLLAPEGRR